MIGGPHLVNSIFWFRFYQFRALPALPVHLYRIKEHLLLGLKGKKVNVYRWGLKGRLRASHVVNILMVFAIRQERLEERDADEP